MTCCSTRPPCPGRSRSWCRCPGSRRSGLPGPTPSRQHRHLPYSVPPFLQSLRLAGCFPLGYAQVLFAPVSSSFPGLRHDGSVSVVFIVKLRRPRMTAPYAPEAAVETLAPGGSSMKGMNLSGKPGIVQPMQMPPTLGHPPTPLIHPRLGTLHLITGPQQPSFTRHFGDPYSVAKSPCS